MVGCQGLSKIIVEKKAARRRRRGAQIVVFDAY
jgi:hypothetical protein